MKIKTINIWALHKHKTIKLLLFQLQSQLMQGNFLLEESGGNEYNAISLVKPDQDEVRAYVYTYGQVKDLYGVVLEYPFNSENEYSNSSPFYEDLTLKQVISILTSHFDVPSYEMAI